jgi:hypothetical protein
MVGDLYNKKLILFLDTIFTDLQNKEEYDLFCEFIMNYILDDYSRVNDKVIVIDEKNNRHEITLFQLMLNFYMLDFNFAYKIPITVDWMVDIDKKFLSNMNKEIEKRCKEKILPILIKRKINQEECFSNYLSSLTERLEKLSELMAPIASPTINLVDLNDFIKRSPVARRLMDTTLDDTKSAAYLEDQLKQDGEEFFREILYDKRSCLFPFVEADCLSQQQLCQMFIAVGPRMSANNVVMAHIMKRSYLNGLQNVGDLIAESEIATKALIYKKKFVGESGYMSREINLAGLNTRIDFTMDDCGTTHYIEYNVKSQKHLDMIINKNIILPNGKLHAVTPEDTDLIGTTVKMRSICCCAHPKRGWVCKKCYGNPADYKRNYRIGGATSTEVQNRTSNAVMSVKHSTSTKTKEFDDPEFLKYFNLIDSSLIVKNVHDTNVYIVFDKEYIEDIIDRVKNDEIDDDDDDEELGEESTDSDNRVVSKFITDCKIVTKTIVNYETEEEETNEYEVHLDGTFLTLAEDMMNLQALSLIELPIDRDEAILDLNKIKPGTVVFDIKYITADSARYLKQTDAIIQRSKPKWYTNLSDPINDFADLMVEANLKNEEVVFLEPVIYALTRDANDIMKRPDFSKKDVEFNVINLKTAILKGDLCSAIVYEKIKSTFTNVDSFERPAEIGNGVHDSSFKTSIKHDFTYMEDALRNAGLR